MKETAYLTAMAVGLLVSSELALQYRAQASQFNDGDKVQIFGQALNMNNTATGANTTIRIDINSWSTPAQRTQLVQAFLEKGPQALLKELEKQPEHGRFNFPGYFGPDPDNIMRLGTDIRYARNEAGADGGRRIVIITPRVIGFRETVNQPRRSDYPFTLFEMRFDKAGSGEGRMSYMTKLIFDKQDNKVEIENYGVEPVRLRQLRLEVRK